MPPFDFQVGCHHADPTTRATLDDDRQRLYIDYVLALLTKEIRERLEVILETGKYQFQSDFAKKYIAIGKAEGTAEGKAEGKAEGFIHGEISALLRFLSKRGLSISADEEKTLRSCTDLTILDVWLERAISAQSVYEVIQGKPAPKKRAKR